MKTLSNIDSFRFPIIPSVCPQNFGLVIVFKCSWENAVPPGAFENNGLCKIGEGGELTECVMGDSKIENRFPTTISINVAPPRAGSSACGSSLKELFHQNSNSENCHQFE